MSVPEYFIGRVYAWLGAEDAVRPVDPLTEPDDAVWTLMGTSVGLGADRVDTVRLTDEGVTWEVPAGSQRGAGSKRDIQVRSIPGFG